MTRTIAAEELASLRAAFDATELRWGRDTAFENLVNALSRPIVTRTTRPAPMLRDRVESIIRDTAAAYSVDPRDIRGPSRITSLTRPRNELFWRLRNCGLSFRVVGQLVGGRDHATVMTGIRRFEARLEVEPALRERLGVRASWEPAEGRAA